MNRPVHGFTLIELSIVLVIIGLIVVGVLVGRGSSIARSVFSSSNCFIPVYGLHSGNGYQLYARTVKDRLKRKRKMARLWNNSLNLIGLLLLSGMLTGCGAAAAPCRMASAGIKAIPVIGGIAATPTDACGEAIDP
jgi:prepilin-type N-terminal cleavage/methylation domain-containing protein